MKFFSKGKPTWPVWLFILGVLFISAILIKRVFFFLLLFVVVFGSLTGIYLFIKMIITGKRGATLGKTIPGGIQQNLERCNVQIEKNGAEVDGIKKEIADIQSKLDTDLNIRAETKRESLDLIAAFKEQLKLRSARLDFYFKCKEKLNTILYNHELRETLMGKRKVLEELKQHDYDDIARMETLKSDIAYDLQYMKTIEGLSLKMLDSTNLDDANDLQLELEELTRELRKL